MIMKDLAPEIELSIPSLHWLPEASDSHADVLDRLARLGTIFKTGSEALGGLYLRICEHIRHYRITPEEARVTLCNCGFSKVRVSEVLRVAYCPPNLYNEFRARVIGFRVCLKKTRLYYMAGRHKTRYKRRQLQRAGVRLAKRLEENGLDEWSLTHSGFEITGTRSSVCYIQLSDRFEAPAEPVEHLTVNHRLDNLQRMIAKKRS